MTTRRAILLAGVAAAVTGCGGGSASSGSSVILPGTPGAKDDEVIRTSIPDNDWPTGTPGSQGIAAGALDTFFTQLAAIDVMRAVVVVRNGVLIGERYFGDAKSSDLRHIRSATKSVTGLLTAQAIEAGKLPRRQTALSQLMPGDLARVPNSGAAGAVMLDHVLNMNSGLKWDEDSRLETLLRESNVTGLALSLPADVYAPGTLFNYNSAVSHLPSTMLQSAYGMDMQSLAQQTLFAQLGIGQVAWSRDATGTTHGAWGLQLRTRDLAKLAVMATQNGTWQGKQLVPAQWFNDIINNKVSLGEDGSLKSIDYHSLY